MGGVSDLRMRGDEEIYGVDSRNRNLQGEWRTQHAFF